MTSVEQLMSGVWIIARERFGSCRLEEGIRFTPYGEQGRLELPEVPLKLRVEIHITRVVEEEIQLDIHVTEPSDHDPGVVLSIFKDAVYIIAAKTISRIVMIEFSVAEPVKAAGFTPDPQRMVVVKEKTVHRSLASVDARGLIALPYPIENCSNPPDLPLSRNQGRWGQRVCQTITGQNKAQGYELSSQP